jgi:hypothetical protein
MCDDISCRSNIHRSKQPWDNANETDTIDGDLELHLRLFLANVLRNADALTGIDLPMGEGAIKSLTVLSGLLEKLDSQTRRARSLTAHLKEKEMHLSEHRAGKYAPRAGRKRCDET